MACPRERESPGKVLLGFQGATFVARAVTSFHVCFNPSYRKTLYPDNYAVGAKGVCLSRRVVGSVLQSFNRGF